MQIIGKVVFPQVEYDTQNYQLTFPITDEHGNRMPVRYGGIKPGNFEQADRVVVIGRYDEGIFLADQLLVKCPSKYQGTSPADSAQTRHPESIPKEPL